MVSKTAKPIASGELEVSDGAAEERPLVTFNPNWAKVFTGESLTMTCYISSAHQNQRFFWYKDDKRLSVNDQTYRISYTETGHTGNYWCRTSSTETSDISRLEVIYDYLILQVPPFAFEEDDVLMRCGSWPGYSVRRTMFFKDNTVIRPLQAETELVLRKVNRESAGKYKCMKKSELSSDTSYTDESFLHVKDLFSSPEVNVTPYPVTEGDNVTLTCDTALSPLRQETKLQIAFYRDGKYVQRLSSSGQYGVQSAELEDSGNYCCEVQTSSSTVKKMSKAKHVQIQDLFSSPEVNVTPSPVTEGDHMTLTCNISLSPLRPGTELQFAFYRDGRNVQELSSSDQYGVQSAQLEDSGNYSCEVKASSSTVKKMSKAKDVQIQELFSNPHVTSIQYPLVEGDHMTLTCNISLSPLRPGTELQFAFYRDGRNVQEFSSSDQYGVQSAQLEHSGNYSCEVRTSAGSAKKRSEEINIQVQGKHSRQTTNRS
ncbi:PREDICTED: Fc receptor-like protein 3 [Nanorana parkeri]|uniref:Fc receptor-like protein 3 n=1 Tax=Nanorana parkeri TaxID=125878 RepID=UPI0008547400|nr:PREDICTED: Fc receptor-like protein 3 [Nanorana parkeri]